eukprot:Sdes_comp19145_c0_seq1m9883
MHPLDHTKSLAGARSLLHILINQQRAHLLVGAQPTHIHRTQGGANTISNLFALQHSQSGRKHTGRNRQAPPTQLPANLTHQITQIPTLQYRPTTAHQQTLILYQPRPRIPLHPASSHLCLNPLVLAPLLAGTSETEEGIEESDSGGDLMEANQLCKIHKKRLHIQIAAIRNHPLHNMIHRDIIHHSESPPPAKTPIHRIHVPKRSQQKEDPIVDLLGKRVRGRSGSLPVLTSLQNPHKKRQLLGHHQRRIHPSEQMNHIGGKLPALKHHRLKPVQRHIKAAHPNQCVERVPVGAPTKRANPAQQPHKPIHTLIVPPLVMPAQNHLVRLDRHPMPASLQLPQQTLRKVHLPRRAVEGNGGHRGLHVGGQIHEERGRKAAANLVHPERDAVEGVVVGGVAALHKEGQNLGGKLVAGRLHSAVEKLVEALDGRLVGSRNKRLETAQNFREASRTHQRRANLQINIAEAKSTKRPHPRHQLGGGCKGAHSAESFAQGGDGEVDVVVEDDAEDGVNVGEVFAALANGEEWRKWQGAGWGARVEAAHGVAQVERLKVVVVSAAEFKAELEHLAGRRA